MPDVDLMSRARLSGPNAMVSCLDPSRFFFYLLKCRERKFLVEEPNISMMDDKLNRREWMRQMGLWAAGGALAGCSAGWGGGAQGPASTPSEAASVTSPSRRKRLLRVAHLTDIHVQPERNAPEGLRACLRHVHALPEKPDLVLVGGDSVMDASGAVEDRAKIQWDLYRKIFDEECSLPVEACLGNHDVWGWKPECKAREEDPRYGKAWAMQCYGLTSPYRSFHRGGWHFIALDSTFRIQEGRYKGRLDDEQFAWLEKELVGAPPQQPIVVFSHIPILSACAYFDGDNEKTGDWVVPGAWMHIDARRIVELFYRHPNVKLCLSGHIHLVDRVDYNGVTYLCNGAVSGNWWKGDYQQCRPGYGLVDLYEDGHFRHEYVPFGWVVAT